MANGMAQSSEIISAIKSISSKDMATSAIAVSQLSESEREDLLARLKKIDSEALKKEKSEAKKSADGDKAARTARFLANLEVRVNNIRNEKVFVKTR